MKKTFSKLFALVMAVLMLSTMLLNASALEAFIATAEDPADCATAEGHGSEFSAKDNAGVFGLRIAKGTDVYVVGCFLVKDGASKYLLTHEDVAGMAKKGYELTVMVPGGTNISATCVAVQEAYDIAYLSAEGMDFYNALSFSNKPFDTNIALGLPYSNDSMTECKRIEYKAFDFSKWTQITEYLFALDGTEAALNWMGTPVFHDTKEYNVQGIGTCYETGSGDLILAIMNFAGVNLNSAYALGAKPAATTQPKKEEPKPEPQPEPEPEPEPEPALDPRVLLIGAVVVAGVAFWIYSDNKKKKEAAARRRAEEAAAQAAAAAAAMSATIPVGPTEAQMTHGVTKAVSNWQLRATGGPLNGKSFPLSGTMKIGRSSKADIRFPDETAGISGSHCEITVSGDTVTVQDVGSTYGTYVNGKRLSPHTPHKLHASDSFTLAQNGISFRLERTGAVGGGIPGGPAVRDVQGKIYKAGASGQLTFGRGSNNTAVLASPDKEISSSHCVLYREGGKLYIKDLGSTNGTFFSEKDRLKPNTPYRIHKGQAFFLCSQKYTFVVTEE